MERLGKITKERVRDMTEEEYYDFWLESHGGRNKSDVFMDDEKKMYVYMSNGLYDSVRIYIPTKSSYLRNPKNFSGNL